MQKTTKNIVRELKRRKERGRLGKVSWGRLSRARPWGLWWGKWAEMGREQAILRTLAEYLSYARRELRTFHKSVSCNLRDASMSPVLSASFRDKKFFVSLEIDHVHVKLTSIKIHEVLFRLPYSALDVLIWEDINGNSTGKKAGWVGKVREGGEVCADVPPTSPDFFLHFLYNSTSFEGNC